MTLVLTAACLMLSSHGKVMAATTSCPAGDSVPADWGNDSDGEGAGVMSSLVMRARDTSGNPINSQFTLTSQAPGWSDNAQIYHWPIGSGGSVSNTDNWPQHGDFQFGTHLSGDGGVSCNGWIVLGPGINGNVGNGWVLNCKNPSGNNNIFQITHIDNPNGQQGQWWMVASDGTVLDYDVNSGTSPHIKFPVTNGANMRYTFVWHQTGWDLNGTTTVDGQSGTIYKQPGESVTFAHSVYNQGPGQANYSWIIKEQHNGGGFSEYGNQDSNGNINVPSGTNGPVAPHGSKSITYSIPTNAQNGDEYCQRIDYSNATGPNTSGQNSQPACVIVGTSPPSHSLGCSATTYTVRHQGGHRQYIQLTGTDSDGSYYVSPDGSGNDSISLSYTALAQTVHVLIHRYTWNGSAWIEDSGSPADHSYGCYHATCNVTSVQGNGPNNIVLAGQPFKVYVSVTNDNTDPSKETIPISAGGHDFSITESGDDYQSGLVFNPTGFSVDPGTTGGPKEIDFSGNGSSSQVRQMTLNFYPDFAGYGSLGTGCSTTFNIYQKFDAAASPAPSANLSPTSEHPSSVSYNAGVDFTWDNPPSGLPDHGVNDNVTATFYKKAADGTVTNPCSPSSYSNGSFTIQSNPTVLSSPAGGCSVPAGSYQAGDEFCTTMTLQYSSGYVGPDNNVVSGVAASAISPGCDRVVNEPYFKVYNGDISAGGSFDQCTTSGGTLAGYADISDPPNATRGSTTQLSALALLKITGVASAKTSASITGPPAKLTFANSGVQVDSTGNESPTLGGQYNGCRTLTNETAPPSAATAGGTFNISGASGAYTHSGDVKVNGGSLAANQNVSLFVTGNVYVASDITYGDGWQAGSAPSLVIHATGNIYIDPGVHKLAGLYIAQDSGGSGGKIYTCATSTGPVSAASLYNTCKNQLIVTGSFVADQVNLMRTFGSLRDEEPNPGSPGAASDASGLVWSSCGSYGHPVNGEPCLPSSGTTGLRCTHINEPNGDNPTIWADNLLCLPKTSKLKLKWKNNGIAKKENKLYCDQWSVPEDTSWDNNYLCMNEARSDGTALLHFEDSPTAGENCIPLIELADSKGQWATTGYYLCAPASASILPSPKTSSYTNCSNAGTQTDTVSCAGEIFEYSPTLYLSEPAVNPRGGGSLQFQSIESLPPVL